MKTRKSFLLLLVFLPIVSMFAYDCEVNGIYYNKLSENELEVTSGDIMYKEDLVIPETVTINDSLFNIKRIGNYAFYNCSELSSVILPNGLISIGNYAFCEVSLLKSITIPNSVEYIGQQAFRHCEELSTVTIGDGLTAIEERTFDGCTKLEKVLLGNSITSIGRNAFRQCGLTSLEIPNTVDSIANNAFSGCNALYSVIIGSGVKKIEGRAFSNCNNIKIVTSYCVVPPIMQANVFSTTTYSNAGLQIPLGCMDDYRNAEGWNKFFSYGSDVVEFDPTNPNNLYINVLLFPDAKFREFLLNEPFGKDGVITEEEIAGITSLDASNMGISNLKGIEYFTALKTLLCYNNNLMWLNLSGNKQLTEVDCYNNHIQGAMMDSLITTLPSLSGEEGSLYVFDSTNDNNICFANQVESAKAKGWIVYYFTGEKWEKYEGRENGIPIAEYNFPDDNFRTFLKNQTYGQDMVITDEEMKGITELYLNEKNISSLKGIEHFTSLTTLLCDSNSIAQLDVSKNVALTKLSCCKNCLTSLDVSKNTALLILKCGINYLTQLDVSNLSSLTVLDCSANKITSVDVSNNLDLTSLNCSGNKINSLDVSKNTKLISLSCGGCGLSNIDVTKNSALTSLFCGSNQLTSLDVTKNSALTDLNCYYNQLTRLDVSKNTALTYLVCVANQLTNIDVSKNAALIRFYCSFNKLTSLDVSNKTSLSYLYCNGNLLTNLDVSGDAKLWMLDCGNNELTKLDISKNTNLYELSCYNNQLESLDVSNNTFLWRLNCYNNQLTKLDMSKNTKLYYLSCQNNLLESIDVSNNASLWQLNCYNNKLTKLDISKNTTLSDLSCFNNQLESLDASQNKRLRYLICFSNKIAGDKMDALINSLPQQSYASFGVINLSDESEGNVCTTIQVNAAKEKGWNVYAYLNNVQQAYEGSAPVGIQSMKIVTKNDAPIFDLNGKRLSEPQKGINIIGGKKILMK